MAHVVAAVVLAGCPGKTLHDRAAAVRARAAAIHATHMYDDETDVERIMHVLHQTQTARGR